MAIVHLTCYAEKHSHLKYADQVKESSSWMAVSFKVIDFKASMLIDMNAQKLPEHSYWAEIVSVAHWKCV